jgi:hypothetical protein
MFDIDRPDQAVFTTGRLVRSCEAAEARLAPLLSIVQPLARTRPDAAASPELLGLARQALRPARRVAGALALAPVAPLHGPVTHAGLAARLALAAEIAAKFRARYFRPDPRARARVWQVHPWVLHALNERLAEDRLEGRIP